MRETEFYLLHPIISPPNPGHCQDNRVAHRKLSVRLHCWRQHTHTTHRTWKSQAAAHMDISPWCSSVFGIGWYSSGYQMKCKHQHNYKTFALQSVLSATYTKVIVIQNLLQLPINVWFDLRSTPQDRTYTQHCLSDQKPDIRWPRDLAENQMLRV